MGTVESVEAPAVTEGEAAGRGEIAFSAEDGGLGDARPAKLAQTRLADLIADAHWPKLAQAVPLALRLDRVLIGTVAALLMLGAGLMAWLIGDGVSVALGMAIDVLGSGAAVSDPARVIGILLLELPTQAAATDPIWTGVLAVMLAFVFAVTSTAVSRSVAAEFGVGRRMPSRWAVRFALERGHRVMIAALIAPMTALVGVVLLTRVAPALFAIEALGVLVHLVSVFAWVLLVFAALCWVVTLPLLPSAAACDGADTFDIIQRAVSFLMTRPGTLLWLVGVAVAQGAVLGLVLWIVVSAGTQAAQLSLELGGAWSELSPGSRVALEMIWAVPVVLAAGVMLSYAYSAGTIIYLTLRRIIDGRLTSSIHEAELPGGVFTVDVGSGGVVPGPVGSTVFDAEGNISGEGPRASDPPA